LPEDSTPPSDAAPVTPEWAFKRLLTIDNTSIGEQTNFPLHVKLDATRISYAEAQPTGADLRFEDAAGTPLAYETPQRRASWIATRAKQRPG